MQEPFAAGENSRRLNFHAIGTLATSLAMARLGIAVALHNDIWPQGSTYLDLAEGKLVN